MYINHDASFFVITMIEKNCMSFVTVKCFNAADHKILKGMPEILPDTFMTMKVWNMQTK